MSTVLKLILAQTHQQAKAAMKRAENMRLDTSEIALQAQMRRASTVMAKKEVNEIPPLDLG